MSAALSLPDADAEYLVPQERALAMIATCAQQLERAATLPAIKMVLTQAEAIAAVMRTIDASKHAKRAALALVVAAEVQLGVITKAIPKVKTGRKPVPGQPPTKAQILADHKIPQYRSSVAERLSDVPPAAVAAAVEKAERMTMREVLVGLKLRPPSPGGGNLGMRKVAMNAIGLLVTCQSQGRAPKAEEVDPMREAFATVDAGIAS